MSFPVGRLILLGFIASLPACIIVNDFKDNLKAYETKPESQFLYRHSSSDFIVAWNTVQGGNETVIDGLIKNVQTIHVKDIALDVQMLDAEGRPVSNVSVLLPQITLYPNQSVAFDVKLQNAVIAEGSILRFNINYRTNAGAWGGGGGSSSFDVYATTGINLEKQGVNRNQP